VKLLFDREGAGKETHYSLFCCCRFQNCELYRALMAVYDDDG